MSWALAVVSLAASGVTALRWLRVGQREHYLPGVTHFARLWWTVDTRNTALLIGVVGLATVSSVVPILVVLAAIISVVAPLGLGVRGRTAPLAWTDRLRRLAATVAVLLALATAAAAAAGLDPVLALLPLLVPVVVDMALVLVRPLERRLSEKWVRSAAESLRRIDPTVVAITGSYGKTTTKNLVAHLLAPHRAVVASPASFNNRLGLARAINEHLVPGSEVFVAEMGTYGAGEIAELCTWIPPDIAVITALGPVHLERMGSVENIARAKREILHDASQAVLSIDHPLLEDIAREEAGHRTVITVSGTGRLDADVVADTTGTVRVGERQVGHFDVTAAHPVNVAAAVAVCLAAGLDIDAIVPGLAALPSVPHRRTVGRSDRGFDIVDDTFNANPAGATAALDVLMQLGTPDGRKVVVTPGMVELGSQQEEANRAFAEEAGQRGVTHLIVVNRTNRRALETGARAGGVGSVILSDTREEAVSWVRENLASGDAVLYENDLPDHYP